MLKGKMSTSHKFHDLSYSQHQQHFDKYKTGGEQERFAQTWLINNMVDTWRHERMYNLLDPLLETESQENWVTLGDGRYGTDAKYIIGKGANALATDLSGTLLKEAKEKGFIPDYKEENAESLSFVDSAFDYVFCKEAYHHFPRPMIALYEMLRVARKGVVLLEPLDQYIFTSILQQVYIKTKDAVKSLLGKSPMDFEETGNYVYSISKREMEKVAIGLNFQTIAFCGINDYYIEGVEFESIDQQGPLYKKTKRMITLYDFLQKVKLRPFSLLCVIIFKEAPSETLIAQLLAKGYEVKHLPRNPYIKENIQD